MVTNMAPSGSSSTTTAPQSATIFEKIVEPAPTTPSMAEAVTPQYELAPAAASGAAPEGDGEQVAADAESLRGLTTNNDGRADRPLDSGGHVGARDARILELETRRDALRTERTALASRIKELEAEVERDSTIASTVDTAVDTVLPVVDAVAGVFGMDDPVQSLTERLLGLEGDRNRLLGAEATLARRTRAMRSSPRSQRQPTRAPGNSWAATTTATSSSPCCSPT